MKRKGLAKDVFLRGGLGVLFFGSILVWDEVFARSPRCDVVVLGGSIGGAYAAWESARNGARTCLFAETDWLGGQMSTQGICALDGPHHTRPIWRELEQHYLEKTASGALKVVRENELIPQGDYTTLSGNLIVDEGNRCLRPILDRIPDRAECWVSFDCCRPRSAHLAFEDFLKPYVKSGKLKIFRSVVLRGVKKDRHGRIQSIRMTRRFSKAPQQMSSTFLSDEFADWYSPQESSRYEKKSWEVRGRVFVDATESGELILLSGADQRLGTSGPECETLQAENVMSFVMPLNMAVMPRASERAQESRRWLEATLKEHCPEIAENFTRYEKENFHVQWGTYRFWSEPGDAFDEAFKLGLPMSGKPSFLGYRRLSNKPQVVVMNFGQSLPFPERLTDRRGGNDYMGGNLLIPREKVFGSLQRSESYAGGWRVEELRKAECHSLAFAKWLREQPEVKTSLEEHASDFLPVVKKDDPWNFFGAETGLSQMPYLRESRRLVGYQGFCMRLEDYETDFGAFANLEDKEGVLKHLRSSPYYAAHPHTIGITSYPFDRRKYPNGEYPVLEKKDMKLTEIPLESLISKNVPNLLAASKNISMHQMVASAARTQPYECNVGRGAGAAAAEAALAHISVHQLMKGTTHVRSVQQRIREGGGTIRWFDTSTK